MSHEDTNLLVDEERHETRVRRSRSSTVADAPTPIPWRPVLTLLLLHAMHPLAFDVIFPFVNQMILEIGIVTDPERVGYYSGLIESSFACMSLIAILPSSYIADKIGRKPVILGGIFGLSISVASFSMSKSFLAMVLSRCLGGALGGAWACTRVMLAELTDRSNQGLAFQLMSIAYRVGQTIGLPLGGLLAHPERKFSLFRTKFWYEYPFALPCFVASALTLGSVILGYWNLKETLVSRQKEQSASETMYGTMSLPEGVTCPAATPDGISTEDSPPSKVDKPSLRSVFTPSVISVLVSNVAMCLVSETLFAVFPLFCFTPVSSGGLGLSEAAIGTQMAIRAVLHIGITWFYSPLQKRFGTVRFYQLIMWTWPLTAIFFPLLNYIARRSEGNAWPLNIALFVFFLIWSWNGFAWTAIVVMVNDAAPSAGALSRINGLSAMAVALPQAIVPASVTSLFTLSIKSGIAGGYLIYIILLVFTCGAAVHNMTLREPESDWRVDNVAEN